MAQHTEREALDIIRAMATRSVPMCINLEAIDRVLADTSEWNKTADGIVPTEFDPDDQFLSHKVIICIDGKVSTDAGYYTKSGRWIIAGRHGDAVNVTHWKNYPSDPT